MHDQSLPFPAAALTPGQILAYLRRICFPSSQLSSFKISEVKPDYGNLNKLLKYQLANVPFENLVLHYGDGKVDLDVQSLWKKIVDGNAGGYCMEVNALFMALLRGVGYQDVWATVARISRLCVYLLQLLLSIPNVIAIYIPGPT